MSGGFFRGTSADQDTRFSNKQAKLLKSQKFPAELEHLVDMSKVKMDVMKPWIANRVTELLGFEDEVLINFIYGLLDGKVVNGKEIQISLTGFMEKNTGKFMKELWTLLISAQTNASGVPQQFLDAKEEETRKKKAEADRIADEIRKKRDKESRELEQERLKKMDGEDEAKNTDADLELRSEWLASKARSGDRDHSGRRNGMRGRGRRSRSRSLSKSFSNSRSRSGERRQRSRSISRSPRRGEQTVPSEKAHRSPRKRSLSPRRRYSPRVSRSPPRRRPSYFRRRSRSPSHRRSVSPRRRRMRSPIRRRSRSPVRRRSVTPVRRRRSPSPARRRSPSPQRRRSPSPRRRRSPPIQHRSLSPVGRQSPSARSPSLVGRRSSSPVGRKSSSPMRRRSPLAAQRTSPSHVQHESPSPVRRRLRSPVRRRSPLPRQDRSFSPVRRRSPSPLRKQHHRSRSAPRNRSPPEARGRSPITSNKRSVSPSRRSSDESGSPVIPKSPDQSSKRRMSLHESPVRRPRNHREDMRSSSPSKSPVRQVRNQAKRDDRLDSPRGLGKDRQHYDSSDSNEQRKENYRARDSEDHISKSKEKRSLHLSSANKHDDLNLKGHEKDNPYPERVKTNQTYGSRGQPDSSESRKKDQERVRERASGKGVYSEISDQKSLPLERSSLPGEDKLSSGEGKKSENKNHVCPDTIKDKDKPDNVSKSHGKVDYQQGGASDSASEESEEHTHKLKERRKHKRNIRHEMESDSDSYDSDADERKEAKRKRKEEKKLRKEERRRRREERRLKKEERRADKLKVKRRVTDGSPLEDDKHPSDVDSSDDEKVPRKRSRAHGDEPGKEQQKNLEIELRMKALESFKAKKGGRR